MYCGILAPFSTALVPSLPITSSMDKNKSRSAAFGIWRSSISVCVGCSSIVNSFRKPTARWALVLRGFENRIQQFEQDVLDAFFLRRDTWEHLDLAIQAQRDFQ